MKHIKTFEAFLIGDKTNLGTVTDLTYTQYEVDGKWFHRSLVTPPPDKDEDKRLRNRGRIHPGRIISAFSNPLNMNKVEKYKEIMDEERLSHPFPPIKGYPIIIDSNDVGEIFLNGEEITEANIGEYAWKVTDGHHRSAAAIDSDLPYLETELERAYLGDEKDYILEYNQMKLFDIEHDSPKDLINFFLKSYISKPSNITNKQNINNWNQAYNYVSKIKPEVYFKVLNDLHSLYYRVDEVGDISNSGLYNILLDYIDKKNLDIELTGEENFMDLDIDTKDFNMFVSQNPNYFDIIIQNININYNSDSYDELLYFTQDTEHFIYRAIKIDKTILKTSNKMKEFDNIGIYWSHSEDGAETYWGEYDSDLDIILVAKVEPRYINWLETLCLNIGTFSAEKEIRLLENSTVEIVKAILNYEEKEIHIDLEDMIVKV